MDVRFQTKPYILIVQKSRDACYANNVGKDISRVYAALMTGKQTFFGEPYAVRVITRPSEDLDLRDFAPEDEIDVFPYILHIRGCSGTPFGLLNTSGILKQVNASHIESKVRPVDKRRLRSEAQL